MTFKHFKRRTFITKKLVWLFLVFHSTPWLCWTFLFTSNVFSSGQPQCYLNFNESSYKQSFMCSLTLFRMDLFGAAQGWGGAKRFPLPKICHTYPTMMKLGTRIPTLKEIQKLYKSRDTPLEFCWNQHFFTGNQRILLYQEIQI